MTDLQKRLFDDMASEALFKTAFEHGFQYISQVFDREVIPSKAAIDALDSFEEPIPESITDALTVIQTLQHHGAPATVAHLGGRYFGFVTGSVVPVGMAAKVLATFWDQCSAMQVMSPVTSKLEGVVEGWLKSIFRLPPESVAGFVSGTSAANLCGLAAGRYRLLQNQGWDVNKKGLAGSPKIRVVAGREAHSTIIKAIGLLGLGHDNVEFIDTDAQGRIEVSKIPSLNSHTLLILQAGNVNSGSFDDFAAICCKAKEAGAWVHIDGAFGLWAAATKNRKHLTADIEHANSWAVDGHKTLNTPYDCGIILCKDKEALTGALHMSGAYIVTGTGRDGMFFTPEMSRRARVIELWATLKYLGTAGIGQMVETMFDRAKQFEAELKGIPGFQVLNDVVFNQVVVACESDSLTQQVMEAIQQERVCWVGGSQWKGRKVIRISVCSWATTERDVSLSVDSFRKSLWKVTKQNTELIV